MRESSETRLHARYMCFFTAVFKETRRAVEECISHHGRVDLPSIWRRYLAEGESKNRNALYRKVVESDMVGLSSLRL